MAARTLAAVAAVLLVTPSHSFSAAKGRLVSVEQAKSLAYPALTPGERQKGGWVRG